MAISRTRKEELVAQYADLLERSSVMILADYKGMSVKRLEALRDEVYKADGAFHITKNTLIGRVLEDSDRKVPADLLQGQLAAGFALNEVPSLAKALVDFAKSEDHLNLVGGFLGENFLSKADIEALADLPSLDQLRAQILGLVNAPARNVASVVASGVRQVVNVIDAYAKKEEGEG